MIEIEQLKALCGSAHSFFQSDRVIIAGGAVRDTLMERPVKDIDVFVPPLDDFDPTLACDRFQERATAFAKRQDATIEFAEQGDYGVDVAKLVSPHWAYPIEIIMSDIYPIDDVVNYDFGLSQCFVTPYGLYMTEACYQDRMSKSITYYHTGDPDDYARLMRSARRLDRLHIKYPDFAYVNCEMLKLKTSQLADPKDLPELDWFE